MGLLHESSLREGHFDGHGSLNKGQRLLSKGTLEELLNAGLPRVSDSAASAGGGATEAMTVEGLKAGDIVTSVSQKVAGAGAGNTVVAYGDAADGSLSVTWDADPGAGAEVRVTFLRP
jgi:hypothetical protein